MAGRRAEESAALARYAVRPGETWLAGRCRLLCGDVTDAATRERVAGWRPDLIYCDLPYNAALATHYRRVAGLPGRADYPALLAAVAGLSRACRGSVFIETGLASAGGVVDVFARRGLLVRHRWEITYYRTRPAALLHFSRGPVPPLPDPSGLDDTQTPAWAARHACPSGGLVTDWTFGRGLTPLAADALGRSFAGTELTPGRVAATLARLAARGHRPTAVA